MKLSTPGEMGQSTGEESSGESREAVTEPKVTLFGDEVYLTEAVELIGQMVDQPEAFGMVAGSSHRELVERVEALEEENERLAESLRQAYRILDEAESVSQFSMDKSVYDPTEEFE